jgi:hypothetical protein
MIRVTFTDTEVHFESDGTGKHYAIHCVDFPAVFGHPRHLMVDFERAHPLLHAALKAVHGGLLAPRVEIRVTRPVLDGLADVDRRTLKDFLIHSGARDVTILDA